MQQAIRYAWSIVLIWSLCFLVPVPALAQISAAETGAATAIGQDMQSRQTGRAANRNANRRQNSESDDAEAADEAAGVEAEVAEDAEPVEGAAPQQKWDLWNDAHSIKRESEAFVVWPKVLLLLVAFLLWVKTGDWINRDAQIYSLGYPLWNAITIAMGILAGVLVFVLPFVASAPIAFLATLGPLLGFVIKHNKSVEPHQKVFTPGWIRHQFALAAGKLGMDVKSEGVADYEKGAQVDLIAMGAEDDTKNKANLITARQSPGYILVKDLVADMTRRRSERVMMDYTQDAVLLRHYVDGVWHNGDATERDSGDVMLAVMKQLCNLKPNERRNRQAGKFGAKFEGVDYTVPIESQGTKTGERVLVTLEGAAKAKLATYPDLGMREKLRDQWSEVMSLDEGFVVISAPADNGLTSLTDISLMETDRLMRDFISVEEVSHPEREIENVNVETYDSKQTPSPATIMPSLIRKYPNVYVMRDMVDGETAKMLLGEVLDGKLVITNVRANGAPEALLRLLQKKVPHKELVEHATAVMHEKLIRLLCDACKVAYEPSPELLKKLGIPAGKVEHLYREPKPEEVNKPCKKCGGVGFFGRTGLFELLIVNDQVREVLLKKPKADLLRKASRNAGMRTHQEEGILLIAKGATSLSELQRVLKN